jgi:hypothetical protein
VLWVASHRCSLDDLDVDELDETLGDDIINEDEDYIIDYGSISDG